MLKKTSRLGIVLSTCLVILSPIHVQAQDQDKFELLGVIHVMGECWEDNSNVHGMYDGQIVRWKTKATGEVATYGFVTIPFSPEQEVEKSKNPTRHYPPHMIELDDIQIDVSKQNFRLAGLSMHDQDQPGLESTCDLRVTKRDMTLEDPK